LQYIKTGCSEVILPSQAHFDSEFELSEEVIFALTEPLLADRWGKRVNRRIIYCKDKRASLLNKVRQLAD
jgi:hypothetical protein